jgi:peptidyl-tRNA hydrolase
MHSKIYILIKDWVDVGHAVNTAGHASLILYLKYKNHPNMKEWLENSFRKVTCKVSEEVFKQAKKQDDYVIVTENAFKKENGEDTEVALAFLPRKEWSKFFKFLQLYK